MLDSIGESIVRTTTRTENNLAAENKEATQQKMEKAVEDRPVESAQDGAKAETDTDADAKKKKNSSYKVDKNGIFFEKYDNKGNVIFRAPPEKNPIDERV